MPKNWNIHDIKFYLNFLSWFTNLKEICRHNKSFNYRKVYICIKFTSLLRFTKINVKYFLANWMQIKHLEVVFKSGEELVWKENTSSPHNPPPPPPPHLFHCSLNNYWHMWTPLQNCWYTHLSLFVVFLHAHVKYHY